MPISDNPYRNKVTLNTEKGLVVVEVIKREDDSVVETKEFAASRVHENLRQVVALYGLSKLLQDRTSETPTGPGKVAAMEELLSQFEQGIYSAERKAGAPVVSVEVEAVAIVQGISVPEAQVALRKYDKATKERIFANERVQKVVAELKEKRKAAEGISLDDLAGAAA